MRDLIEAKSDVIFCEGYRDPIFTKMPAMPINRLLDQSSYRLVNARKRKVPSCRVHMLPNEFVYLGRQLTSSPSGLKCRIPNLVALLDVFTEKYSMGIDIRLGKGSIRIRCPTCAWDASVVNAKRTEPESRASGFFNA